MFSISRYVVAKKWLDHPGVIRRATQHEPNRIAPDPS
jgi:hypothetical protein